MTPILRLPPGLWLVLAVVIAGCGSGSLMPGNDAAVGAQDAPAAADVASVDAGAAPDGAPGPDVACINIYRSPGCGASAPPVMCVTSAQACINFACSCAGTVTVGCNGAYGQTYAFVFNPATQPQNPADVAGDPCDPAGCGNSVCPWPSPDAAAGSN
jgi:hypothetical protein